MANDKNFKNFTAADIEKYHTGLLSANERHALEKAALDDPFLADALEGYATPGVNIENDLADLHNRLNEKYQTAKVIPLKPAGSRKIPWLRVAALLILIVGGALIAYQFGFNKNEVSESELAQAPKPADDSKSLDSITPAQTETNFGSSTVAPATDTALVQNGAVSGNTTSATTLPFQKTESDAYVFKKEPTTNEPKPLREVTTSPAIVSTDQSVAFKLQTDTTTNKVASNAPVTAQAESKSNPEAYKYNDNSVKEGIAARQDQAKRKVIASKDKQMVEDKYVANIFRGRVTDNNNNPVPFANVTNTEDNVGTYADARGFFNLTSPDSTLNVQVRSLGYNSNNVQLKTNISNNAVVMVEDRSINPVVISNKKPNATYRASAANMKLEGEPEPEDGWDNYDSYLANNLNVPEDYKIKQSGAGEVKVSFEVNKYGEPVNFRIVKSLCTQCDQEAIRLIKEGPKWKRRAKKGRTTVTISF